MQTNMTYPLRQVSLAVLLAFGLAQPAVQAAELDLVPEYTLLDAIKDGKSLSSLRLRYEHVDQDLFQANGDKLERANAFTLRSLIGWQTAPFHNFSAAVQVIDVAKIEDEFNDREGNVPQLSRAEHAVVVDPEYTNINQLFVDWTGIKNTKARFGRQQVNLDNVRFVGDIAFRQVMQVFDGLSVTNKSIPDTEIFLAHFDKVRQINTELRDGNIEIVNAKYRISPSESLVGYGYFIDADNLSQNLGNPAAAGNIPQGGNGLGASSDSTPGATTDASSRTLGLRLDGVRKIDDNWKAIYTAEFAKQNDYKDGSSLIDAHYLRMGGGAAFDKWSIRLDHEVLSSNNGQYAFQTPLGTNHLFQGWADLFLVTPRQGIRDTYVTVATTVAKAKISAEYHVFRSDENFTTLGGQSANQYGKEFDIGVTYPFSDKLMAKLEYAKFMEDDVYGTSLAASQRAFRKADTEKIWATVMLSF